MNIIKKIRIAMIEQDISQVELAKRTGQTQANLSRKLNQSTMTFAECERLVEGMGCKLEINIVLPDGRRV